MILVIVLGAPLAAMAVFSLAVVYLSPLWIIASLLFAPFAGRMYERAATAAGAQQDRRTLRRSGMIAGALLIVPWVYMMRHLRGGEQRTGSWVFHPRAVYLLWLLGPTVLFFFFAVGGTLTLLGQEPIPAWMYIGIVAAPCSLLSLLRVSSTPQVRSLPDRPWSLLRPYAWAVFWMVVAIPMAVFVYFAQEPRPFSG